MYRTSHRPGARSRLLALSIVALALTVGALLQFTPRHTSADSLFIDFTGFTDGNPNGQFGWSKTGGYDVAIVDIGGNKALRASNAVTSGSFGDQTFSAPLANEAGEKWAANNGLSGGTRQNHFEASWDVKSFTGLPQAGLVLSFSPDRGDGARMSYLRVEDNGLTGLNVYFIDYSITTPWFETLVATIDYTNWHNLKLEMDFRDGPSNDVVRVYVDNALEYTGTSWEQYFRFYENNTPRTVDSLLIRAGGTAAPGTLNAGLLIDNVSLESSTEPLTPPASNTVVVQQGSLVTPPTQGWLFYNDGNDTVNNTLGSFVSGPATAPAGTGSAQITVDSTQRTNLSTFQFTGTPLSTITRLEYSSYSTNATLPPFLVMNVDFNLSDTWQRRLVFVPPTPVATGAWVDHDAIAGGAALWTYSGTNWPAPNAALPGTTALPWAEIQNDYPNARIRVTDAHVGIRVGHPTAGGDTANLDKFVFGTAVGVTTFDFEPTVPCTTTCYVDAVNGNDGNDGAAPGTAKKTIQAGVNAVDPAGTVIVAAGTYNEDVNINKAGVTVQGAGASQSIVIGPIGGDGATFRAAALGVVIDGFGITRAGNNLADWNDPNLNFAGVAVQGLTVSVDVKNSRIYGNRTAVDVNNSNGNEFTNNVIEGNHTGLIFRNQTNSTVVTNNFIRDNRTVGVLFLDASGGTNVPLQQALTSDFNHNSITGNWYGGVVDRQSGGSLPAPGTNLKDFESNWLGTVTPVVTTANSAEPGYGSLIPVEFGGSAVNPGGAPDIAGPASANLDYQPILCSGQDISVAFGFQPNLAGCGDIVITSTSAAQGQTGITVQVRANNVASLFGVQAYLQYDNSKLQLTNVTLGTGLLPQFAVALSQPGNHVNFAYTQLAPTPPVSGSGIVLATLTFTALAEGTANVEFRTSPPTLFADPNSFTIGPLTKTNGAITIGPALGSVSGKILLQGRTNHAGSTGQIDPSGGPSGLANTLGDFSISAVSVGAHTLEGRMLGYLRATKAVNVPNGNLDAGTVTLLGGDANMDNVINIADLSLIGGYYGQGPAYTPPLAPDTTPDINGDNVVNILDISLTGANYLQTGPKTWP